MKTVLIDRNTVSGESQTFEIVRQITVHAQGLEPGDVVNFYMVQLTDLTYDPCSCPPNRVELPKVLDEEVLRCCGVPIALTREHPFVIMDAPQGVLLRAKLTYAGVHSTQRVYFVESNTQNVNDRLRGCPCAEAPSEE